MALSVLCSLLKKTGKTGTISISGLSTQPFVIDAVCKVPPPVNSRRC